MDNSSRIADNVVLFCRTLREAVRTEGDVMKLPKLARKTRHRPVLLLIEICSTWY